MRFRLNRCLVSLIAVISFLGSPQTAQAQGTLPGWTILIYLDGDNNLEREAIDDFLEMATIGSSAEVNVIVQLDRTPGYDLRYGDWTGTLRFRVERGMTPETQHALADLGEANMGDPQSLVDFVTWGMATFPAQRTALVLWNHGDGWRTSSLAKERRKAICWDDTNGRDALDSEELRQVMASVTDEGAAPLDMLAFDACLMAMIEIDAQLHPYVNVRVASEETEPGTGYPYDTILAHLVQDPGMDGAALGTAIVEHYYRAYNSETQSAVDLANAQDRLVAAVDELARTLIDHGESEIDAIRDARREVQQFQASYVDLYDLVALLMTKMENADIHNAAQAVIDAVDNAVLANRNGVYWPGAHGISIYFPAQPNLWDSQYAGENDYLTFTAETRWDDWLISYLQLAASCDPDTYEPDGDPATAPAIAAGGKPQRHNFCPAADTADWASISAQAGQRFEITTSELEYNSDTVLKLFDTDGETLLARDDDGGAGLASRITWTSPVAGTYYIQVIEYYGRTGQDTGYTLSVKEVAPPCQPDLYEPDNTIETAKTIAVDGPMQQHSFCPDDDWVDWVSLKAEQGQIYAFESHNLGANADTVLTLVDQDGTSMLPAASREDLAGSHLQWICPTSGQYYLQVRERDGRTGPGTEYELGISTVPLTIGGTVSLQGRTEFDGTVITIQPSGDTTTTGISGSFSLTATLPCTITATHPGYLSAQWHITETTDPKLNLEPAALWGGDVNADGKIDILDLAFVGARFGSNDDRADINGDGMVDIRDLVLPAGNFGRTINE